MFFAQLNYTTVQEAVLFLSTASPYCVRLSKHFELGSLSHDVTWSRADSFCEEQFPEQPEEFPTAPVKASMHEEPAPAHGNAFGRFNFDTED